MAMTKEEQELAASRIIARHPLTSEEQQTFELLIKRPEDYVPPNPESGVRVCGVCGAMFQDKLSPKGEILIPVMEMFTDHQAEHNPTPAQWAEAHRRIQAGKERLKAM